MKLPVLRLVREGAVEYNARPPCSSVERAARVCQELIGNEPRETLVAVFVDCKMRPTGIHVVSVGTIDHCLAYPREIFGPALIAGSHGIFLAHNHPSGDSILSLQDIALWDRIQKAGEVLGIPVHDFITLGARGWRSCKHSDDAETVWEESDVQTV